MRRRMKAKRKRGNEQKRRCEEEGGKEGNKQEGMDRVSKRGGVRREKGGRGDPARRREMKEVR